MISSMAMISTKTQCSICEKDVGTFMCQGCSQQFCWNDLNQHHQLLDKQFDQIESDHNELRQKLFDHKNNSIIEEINQWEHDSIEKIKQTAEQCRQILMDFKNKLENQLNTLAKQIKDVREENNFNEIDLNYLKEKLMNLLEELDKPSNLVIEQQSTSFINKISISYTTLKSRWKRNGLTIGRENDFENKLNHISCPRGICIDSYEQILYITDWWENCIVQWNLNEQTTRIVAGGNREGNQLNQPTDVIVDKRNNSLIIADKGNRRVIRWSRQIDTENGEILISDIDCWGLAMDKDGSLYVSDSEKNEVRRWKQGETIGTIVAGGNGKGDNINQLNWPKYIFVDDNYSLYISDWNNCRIMKWKQNAQDGIIVAGDGSKGNSLTQLSSPQGVIVDQFGHIYTADWDNHRIMCWCEGEREGTIVIGGIGNGDQSNQLSSPVGLSFDQQGNFYVADCNNNRIQKFELVSYDDNPHLNK